MTLPTVSLKQAAELAGRSKSTILNQLKKGKLHGEKNAMGEWEIQVCDLEKLYKLKQVVEQSEQPESNDVERLKLEHQLEVQSIQIEQLKRQLEKAEATSQQFYDLAQKNANLLTHYVEEKETEKPKLKRDWLGRIKR